MARRIIDVRDSVTVSELLAREAMGLSASAVDTVAIADGAGRRHDVVIADAMAISEANLHPLKLASATDAVAIAEALTSEAANRVSDSVIVTDSILLNRIMQRAVEDALAVSESLSKLYLVSKNGKITIRAICDEEEAPCGDFEME